MYFDGQLNLFVLIVRIKGFIFILGNDILPLRSLFSSLTSSC